MSPGGSAGGPIGAGGRSARAARRSGALCAATAAALLVGACAHRPVPVHDAVRFDPPAEYAAWWREVEGCSGRTADFGAVDWFVVPGVFFEMDGRPYDGYWFKPFRIVLARERADDPILVRHEILHALLQRAGHGEEFQRSCRGLVDGPRGDA